MAVVPPIVFDLELPQDLKDFIAAEVSKQLAERDKKLSAQLRAARPVVFPHKSDTPVDEYGRSLDG